MVARILMINKAELGLTTLENERLTQGDKNWSPE